MERAPGRVESRPWGVSPLIRTKGSQELIEAAASWLSRLATAPPPGAFRLKRYMIYNILYYNILYYIILYYIILYRII